MIDGKGDGVLDLEELIDALQNLVIQDPDDGTPTTETGLKNLFNKLANPATSELEFKPFSAVGLDKSVLLSKSNLKKGFKAIDLDKDGKINPLDIWLAIQGKDGPVEEEKELWERLVSEELQPFAATERQ